MNLSFPGARPKISFLRPVSRENFANALGQTCIHDLRLRHLSEKKIRSVCVKVKYLALALITHPTVRKRLWSGKQQLIFSSDIDI